MLTAGARCWARPAALLMAAVAVAAWPVPDAGYGWTFWVWVAALGLYVGSFRGAQRPGAAPSPRAVAGLVAILAMAAATRLPALTTVPGNISVDELLPGVEALRIARGEAPNVVASLGWFTMPTLSFAPQAVVVALAGHDAFWGLRLSSALMGLAGLGATFALGRRLVGERAALAGTFLMAVSFWHVHNSRTGFPFWQSSLGTALALYLLARGRQDDSRATTALAGVVTGMVLQWYFPVRILVLVCPLFLLADWRQEGGRGGRLVGDAVWFGIGVALALGPLLAAVPWSALTMHSRDVLRVPAEGGWSAGLVADHASEAVRMLSRWSDVAVLNRSPAGLLDGATRVALAVGVVVAFLQGRAYMVFLVGWFGLTFVGGVMLTDAPRASYRLAAAMPAIFLLAGVGVDHLLRAAPAERPWYGRTVRPVLVGLAAVWVAAHNGYLFFVEYLREDGRETPQAGALRELAAHCDGRRFYVALGIEHGPVLDLFCRDAEDVTPSLAVTAIELGRPATVLLAPNPSTPVQRLQACFPGTAVRMVTARNGEPLLVAVDVPASGAATAPGCADPFRPPPG